MIFLKTHPEYVAFVFSIYYALAIVWNRGRLFQAREG